MDRLLFAFALIAENPVSGSSPSAGLLENAVIGLTLGARIMKPFALRLGLASSPQIGSAHDSAVPSRALAGGTSRMPVSFPFLAISLPLLADVVLFFAKPLFSRDYILPWDFRGIQLPLLTFLRDRLQQGQFAL